MSSNTSKSLKFCTYNCHGWKSGCDYVNDLLKSCDFCLIQEHWLFQDQFSTMNICNDFHSVSVSGMSGDELILGRPYGGCTIFFRKSFSHSISRLKSCSTRFCALLLKLLDSSNQQIVSILIVNVYLPTNYGSDESTTTFQETVAELEGLVLTQTYDHVIIAADFNVDFAKVSPNRTILECFTQAFDLVRGDICSDISFTYRRDDHQSWVDHVICSSAILNTISNIMSIDSVDNFSDHLLVFFTLNCSTLSTHLRPILICQTPSTSDSLSMKINWSKITEDDIRNFRHLLQHNLPSLSSSAHSCIDPQCSAHKHIIDHFCNQLLVAIDLFSQNPALQSSQSSWLE